jgi:hypothetical protein
MDEVIIFQDSFFKEDAFRYKDKKNEFVIKKKKKKVWVHSLILHYDGVMPLFGGYKL